MFNFLRFRSRKAGIKTSADKAAPDARAVPLPLSIKCSGHSDFVLLISGAGIGDTGGGLCIFDGATVHSIDRVTTAGMALSENRLARILSTPISTGSGEILIYDQRGITNYLRIDELSDAHYLVWHDGKLAVTSTGTNSVVWVSLNGDIVRCLRLPGEDDSWHLNGIYCHAGQLYGCAFGKYDDYRGYKERLSEGDGFVFELESGRVVARGLCAPHTPVCFDGVWSVCDSLRNTLVQFDANTGQRLRQVQLRAFTRGLAVTDDYLIVGESNQRHESGKEIAASFAVLRRSDLGLVSRFLVPFREISDIIVVPKMLAEGTRIGFRTNPLRVSESDQLQMFRDAGIEPRRLWAVSERLPPEQCRIRVEAEIPRQFTAGKLALVECTVTNIGEHFLSSELPFPVFISYKWRRTEKTPDFPHLEGIRTRLPKTLAPGESIRCRMEIQAPEVKGPAKLIVTMVQERVLWFDETNPSNACARVVNIITASPRQGT